TLRMEPEIAKSSMKDRLSDAIELSKVAANEIRAISYLLHPPLLDELGLVEALREYVDGFSQRSRIQATLECWGTAFRLPTETETSIFRIVQECLTNIHRHSKSSTASIRITGEKDCVIVEIKDSGKGFQFDEQTHTSAEKPGVGIRGMRERVRQLGG